MQEKRSAKRVEKNLIIQYSIDTDTGVRKWDVSSVKDISEKGVSFMVNGKVSLGTIIHMLIRIPLKPFEWFELSGKVLGSKEYSFDSSFIRVIFLDLKEEQKTLIRDYIAWCLSKDGGKK
jgi:hypothetical protein